MRGVGIMKRLVALTAATLALSFGCPVAHAETVVSVTQFSYDYLNHPVCSAVRMNPAVYGSLPSDACALGTTSTTYGPDRITKNTYDAAGQLIEVDQAYGVTTANGFPQTQRAYARYVYSPNGLKIEERDANGNRTTYSHDGLDRLGIILYPSTTTPGQTNSNDYEAFYYDANGNRTWYRRRDGRVISYTYDNLNRELTRIVSDGSVQTVYSGYDGLGHLLYARYGSTSGSGVTNAYDGLGRLSATQDLNGRWVQYQYNQASARIQLTFPDLNNVSSNLDNDNRVTSMFWNGSSGLILKSYDDLGRLSGYGRPGSSTGYGYDAVGRLASMANAFNGAAYNIGWTFGYNPASQVINTSASSTLYDYKETDTTTVGKTYDGLNRDATIAAISNGYDANGNLTNDGSRLFYYDIYNRLTGVGSSAYPQNGPYLTFAYDPLGRLASQTYYGTMTSFLYDGSNLIGEYDINGNLLERYIHGDGVDDPLVWFHGPGTSDERFFIKDYHGSVIGYTDGAGNLTQLYKYGPYGEPKNISNGTDFTGARFRYTGQTVIPEAGLYYYKARVYDPIMGRFLQTDPIGSKDDLDLYAYTADDPVNRSDPTGTQCAIVCPNGAAARQQTAEGAQIVQNIKEHPGQTIEIVGNGIQAASIVTAQPEGVVAGNRVAAVGSFVKAVSGETGTAVPVTTSKGPDFIVNSQGTVMRPTTAGNRQSLENAGISGTPTTQTSEQGTVHTVNGTDIRIMNGGSGGPPRIVTSRAGTNDPVQTNGQPFPNGTPKAARRDGSHQELDQ